MMARRLSILTIILLSGGFFSRPVLAIPLLGSNAPGRAGTGVAALNIHDVYTSNPSTMVGAKYYSVGAGFTSDGNTLQTSIVDTQTSQLAGAVSYHHQIGGARYEDPVWKTNGIHLALASALSPGVSLGLTGKYLWFEQIPVAGALRVPGIPKDRRFDLDMGLHYKVIPALAFGAVFRNAFTQDHIETVPLPDLVAGLTLAPSADFALFADGGVWLKNSSVKGVWNLAAGAEYRLIPEMLIRAGYRFVTSRPQLQAIGSGLAVNFDTAQVAYAATLYINANPFQSTHGVSLTLMF